MNYYIFLGHQYSFFSSIVHYVIALNSLKSKKKKKKERKRWDFRFPQNGY